MRIKVHGGTAQGGGSLCYTCRHADIIRGARLRDEIIECGMLSYHHNRITFPVTSCSSYVDSNHPSLREMEEIAWVLRTDAHRKQVGFVHAQKLPERDRYVLDED
jgi:hypothetical protein